MSQTDDFKIYHHH